MAAVTPSSDKAADLLQNLSLDSEPKNMGVPEPAKKNGPAFSNGAAKGMNKPFNPNASFVPNGYHSTAYYYGGYDGQSDWNMYSRYMNVDGGMAQGVYGDSCSYMYNQGYGYTPYGAYPPPATSPPIQHDGQLYGMQQYHYPSCYYQSPASTDMPHASNKIGVPQVEEISTAVNADHVPSSNVFNKGNTVTMANGDRSNKKGLNAFLTGSQHGSLNSNDFYQVANMPACVPLSGHQGPRISTHGQQSAFPSDVPLISDRQSKHGAKAGISSSVGPLKDFNAQRNQRLPQPLPQFTNFHSSRGSSGLELVSGFMNRMYPINSVYSRYGNTFRADSRYGSTAYGSRAGFENKLRGTGDGYGVDHLRKNVDGFGEMNKGPRSIRNSDNKGTKSLGPVTLLLKGQDLPVKSDSDNKEATLAPKKEQYNGEHLPENYTDAKFFVIKSYSEDDVHKSIKYSVWASTPNGNKKLDAAYQEAKEKSCPIFLLFSVNTSGQFVGLAEMVGPVDFGKTVEYWQQDRWTGCFAVKWHIIKDIPNSILRHITLENNEHRPVTNSRDTQEVQFDKGIQIVKIFKEHSSKACILDDFGFYETREKATQERKSKEHAKQVSNPSEITIGTIVLPKSLEGSLLNGSAAADATEGKGNGAITVLENSSKSC
ncbi:YTH domain-containing protein ECT4 isoform X1 [Arachis duranensis]|uniref:YTH domain-containing family protein n=2 Tax=Arachis duranensis TaxID=130453 RepID=A0A6P4DRB1_ARADU|nr:YTH domain-containing protein ECT4 isoform X1 [Arachis duranensis]